MVFRDDLSYRDLDPEDDPLFQSVVATGLAFSNDPPNRRLGPRFAAVVMTLGLLVAGWGALRVTDQPWDLVGVEVWAVQGDIDWLGGDGYRIAVQGQSYDCYRGRQARPNHRQRVVYDPRSPRRCRAVDSVGRLAPFEWLPLLAGGSVVAFGLAWLFAFYAEPREAGKRKNPPPLLRPWLMWLARVVLVGSLGLAVFTADWRCDLGKIEPSAAQAVR